MKALTSFAVMLLVAAVAAAQIPAPTDAPKPLSPAQSTAAFKLPDGFRMEVVASKPLIESPSAVCWDERGRMFISELPGYNLVGQLDIEELNKTGKLDTQVRGNLGDGLPNDAEARNVNGGEPSPKAQAKPALMDFPKLGIFEQAFTQQRSYGNPYVEVTANATFVQPAGRRRSISLFWDGGANWKVRFSPDLVGAWSWSVSSSDPGLNGANGSFNCVSSTNRGGVMAMTGYPYHFQDQDGAPYWLFGDTQWESFAEDPGQGLDTSSVSNYFTIRAAQGYNYVHSELIGLVRSSNIDANGKEQPAFHDYRAETINSAYFNEVDTRLLQANALGITLGLILMEPYFTPAASIDPSFRYDNRCWMSFPDEAARLRYARYVVARYSAFNVLFLLTLEWGPAAKPIPRNECIARFNRIGTEIQNHDPHQRLRGIHDDNGTLPNDFYGDSSGWNTLGQ